MSAKGLLAKVDLSNVKRDYAWYTVATLFNSEESYIQNVKDAVTGTGLTQYFKEYYIPLQYVKKDGKLKKLRGDYSGYVFIKCILTAKVWNLLRTASGASVVLTAGGIPIEMPVREINKIRSQNAPNGLSNKEFKHLQNDLRNKYCCKGIRKPEMFDSDFNTDFTA